MSEDEWVFERRIPAALLITLLIQIGAGLIWATQLDARVASVEQQSIGSVAMNEKFARLEERLDFLKQNISGIKGQLDKLADKVIPDAAF